jgi:hypothetical protein
MDNQTEWTNQTEVNNSQDEGDGCTYDNNYCPECPGESITAEFNRLKAEKKRY